MLGRKSVIYLDLKHHTVGINNNLTNTYKITKSIYRCFIFEKWIHFKYDDRTHFHQVLNAHRL